MTDDLAALIERARQTGDPAAQQLADIVEHALKHPDRRVGAALLPKRRGGEPQWRAEQRTERDDAYRALARAEFGTVFLTPTQANALAKRATRALRHAQILEGDELGREAIRRIKASGLEPLGERQLRRILSEVKKI